MLLHLGEYVANGVIFIVSRQFGNKSHGDRFAFVCIRIHSRSFTRFCEFLKQVHKIRKDAYSQHIRKQFASHSDQWQLICCDRKTFVKLR